jgi:hypothetical protein
MSGLVSTSDGKRQINADSVDVTRATQSIIQLRFMQGISLADDTWLLGGKQLTLSRNAMPAIFTAKENSGFLAAVLKAKTPEQLRDLCDKRTKAESSRHQSYNTYSSITEPRRLGTQRLKRSRLNQKKRRRYDKLREERNELLDIRMISNVKELGYGNRWEVFKRISREMYELTGHYGYFYT